MWCNDYQASLINQLLSNKFIAYKETHIQPGPKSKLK